MKSSLKTSPVSPKILIKLQCLLQKQGNWVSENGAFPWQSVPILNFVSNTVIL